jgi:ABC-type Na+ efflux pump permease subunit
LISIGVISIVPLIISQSIIDICGDVRQYMIASTLSLLSYWIAAFVIDFCIWMITVTLIWVVFLAAQVASFHDNAFSVWYAFMMSGSGFIIMMYCLAFMFHNPESAARQAFMVMVIIILIPVIVGIIIDYPPSWVEWLFSLIPILHLQRLMTYILISIGTGRMTLDIIGNRRIHYHSSSFNGQAFHYMVEFSC